MKISRAATTSQQPYNPPDYNIQSTRYNSQTIHQISISRAATTHNSQTIHDYTISTTLQYYSIHHSTAAKQSTTLQYPECPPQYNSYTIYQIIISRAHCITARQSTRFQYPELPPQYNSQKIHQITIFKASTTIKQSYNPPDYNIQSTRYNSQTIHQESIASSKIVGFLCKYPDPPPPHTHTHLMIGQFQYDNVGLHCLKTVTKVSPFFPWSLYRSIDLSSISLVLTVVREKDAYMLVYILPVLSITLNALQHY